MSAYVLVLILNGYNGNGTSANMTTVPMYDEKSCEIAGKMFEEKSQHIELKFQGAEAGSFLCLKTGTTP